VFESADFVEPAAELVDAVELVEVFPAESVQAVVVPEVEFEVAEQSELELNFEPEVVELTVVELAAAESEVAAEQ